MGVCFTLSKLGLFVLDFIFVLVGLLAIAIGIWTVVDSSSFFETIAFFTKTKSTVLDLYADAEAVKIAAAVLIAIGGVVFLISFCGCWAVVSEHRGLLITYATLMSFIIVVEIICVILLFTLNYKWQPELHERISETFSKTYRGTLGAFPVSQFDPFSLALDSFMIEFECCGIHGPKDFENQTRAYQWFRSGRTFQGESRTYSDNEVLLPVACCQFSNTTFFKNQQFSEYLTNMKNKECTVKLLDYHSESCLNVIPKQLESRKVGLIVTPVVILTLQLICIGLAVHLAVVLTRWNSELFY